MKPESDLFLLKEQLASLSQSQFYDQNIRRYITSLEDFVGFLLSRKAEISGDLLRKTAAIIWNAYHHLNGTTSREVPYEIIYCLELALKGWQQSGTSFIIATELLNDKSFYLRTLPHLRDFQRLFPGYAPPPSATDIIYVALPRIYRNTPLYCIPLYHELGHFVDMHRGNISKRALLTGQTSSETPPTDLEIMARHYGEYFADIFAASFIGDVMARALEAIAPDGQDCNTHPATRKRINLIESFLAGKDAEILRHFRLVLEALGLPALNAPSSTLAVATSFADCRPLALARHERVHDLFTASWRYLESDSNHKSIKLINDLIEKTIRSYAIKRAWDGATSL